MSAENNKAVKPDESQNPEQTIDKSRRSIAKVGAVAPVLLSLVSKTVWGQTVDQCTTSGNLSGNTSPGHQYQNNCDSLRPFGLPPNEWLNTTFTTANFNTVFAGRTIKVERQNGPNWADSDTNPTLLKALQVAINGLIPGDTHTYRINLSASTGAPPTGLASDVSHAIAGWLNANSVNYAYPFPANYVKRYYETGNMGLISGFASVITDRSQVMNWLVLNGLYVNGSVQLPPLP